MNFANAFNFVSSELEKRCDLSQFVARGTLRLALRDAGLDPHWVTWVQMKHAVDRVLASELVKRSVADSTGVCREILALVETQMGAAETSRSSPEDFLRRVRSTRLRMQGVET